jgi:hypothetical protein
LRSVPTSVNLWQRISPNTSVPIRELKLTLLPKKRQIMGENCRGTAQGEGESASQNFTLFRQFTGQPIDNQIRIDLSHDRDIKPIHRNFVLSFIHHYQLSPYPLSFGAVDL